MYSWPAARLIEVLRQLIRKFPLAEEAARPERHPGTGRGGGGAAALFDGGGPAEL